MRKFQNNLKVCVAYFETPNQLCLTRTTEIQLQKFGLDSFVSVVLKDIFQSFFTITRTKQTWLSH